MNFRKKMLASKKGLLVVCTTVVFQTIGFAQENFNYDISGTIPGGDKILLAADIFGSKILDSAENKEGRFSFKGKSASVTFGTLIVEGKNKMFSDYYNLFIEPGKIKVRLYESGRQAEVRGSKNNNIMTEVESKNKEFWSKLGPMYDSINYASKKLSELHSADVVNEDSVKYFQALHKRMEAAAEPYIQDRNKKLAAAFKKYPQSLFTAYSALNSGFLSEDTLKSMYANFNEALKSSSIGKEWHQRLFEADHLETGTDAPDFSTTDVAGKKLSLGDYRGKYVLLDFWATWCMPCRASNPHLIELYTKYKGKGIEFIGIADDDKNIAGWKKAIKNDGIEIWPQVLRGRESSDNNAELTDLSKLYMVNGYPTKILIDKEGKIVAQWVGDDELEKVLSDIFGKI